jgi:hypothetical protein
VEPKVPMAGCDAYVYPPGKKEAVALIGQSDRQGRLSLSPGKDSIMSVLLVKNGKTMLAKLPIVPGLQPRLMAELPKDDNRLKAEGFIGSLQEEIFDLVARQKILATRVKVRIEAKQFDKAGELIDEVRQLPGPQQFVTRMVKEQEKLATGDQVIQKKIDKLFDDTRKLITQHLSVTLVEELDRDLRDAKLDAKAMAGK